MMTMKKELKSLKKWLKVKGTDLLTKKSGCVRQPLLQRVFIYQI